MTGDALHPIVAAAADGELPPWADVSRKRAAHIERVRDLLAEWAGAAGLSDVDAARWRAVGTLHDALHDAPQDELRTQVPTAFRDLPGKILHGPACVVRLRGEGVTDEALLHAINYHTIGHPQLGDIGRALYAADYLEPGRPEDQPRRAALRSRMPDDIDAVVPMILKARLLEQITAGKQLRTETLEFWNAVASVSDERRA
ncbi:MAG: HD domain-containing protein [Longimicrobiales bacterium]